ncbi:MAG: helix-hairpin-helix domain-containing protein [Burkholderiales bacterium]|nr:helix-hairpin-helix domain-containing protein [Burkholderiales bacterium]
MGRRSTDASAPAATRRARARPPSARRPAKARDAADCDRLEQIPNVGPSIAADLRRLGIAHPRDLAARDAFALYRQLCDATGQRQDPCVLDVFMAAVDFMRGAPARPWWAYTAERKRSHGPL